MLTIYFAVYYSSIKSLKINFIEYLSYTRYCVLIKQRNVQYRGLRSTEIGLSLNSTPSVARGLKHGFLEEGISNQLGVYQAGGRAFHASETRRKRQETRLRDYMGPKLSRAWE